MKVAGLVVFGVGYILGTKAGRERYGQILVASKRASERLEQYSRKLEQYSERPSSSCARRDCVDDAGAN